MIFILGITKNSWNAFFSDPNSQFETSKTVTSQLNVTSAGLYVLNCLFKSCSSTNNGGALSSTATEKLLIESTLFDSCSTSSDEGGAVYFMNTASGQCVFNMVCSYKCSTTRETESFWGLFTYKIGIEHV